MYYLAALQWSAGLLAVSLFIELLFQKLQSKGISNLVAKYKYIIIQ